MEKKKGRTKQEKLQDLYFFSNNFYVHPMPEEYLNEITVVRIDGIEYNIPMVVGDLISNLIFQVKHICTAGRMDQAN